MVKKDIPLPQSPYELVLQRPKLASIRDANLGWSVE